MGGKKGFTLVEMMVVMAIIAVLALLGIAAIININSANIVDRATEEIVTSIRESQNMAISIASSSVEGENPPLAWGLFVDQADKSLQPFYLNTDKDKVFSGEKMSYSSLDELNIVTGGDSYFLFTTPFAKYYSTNVDPDNLSWESNPQRPHDIIPTGVISNKTEITVKFRNNTKSVIVDTSGDAYVQ